MNLAENVRADGTKNLILSKSMSTVSQRENRRHKYHNTLPQTCWRAVRNLNAVERTRAQPIKEL